MCRDPSQSASCMRSIPKGSHTPPRLLVRRIAGSRRIGLAPSLSLEAHDLAEEVHTIVDRSAEFPEDKADFVYTHDNSQPGRRSRSSSARARYRRGHGGAAVAPRCTRSFPSARARAVSERDPLSAAARAVELPELRPRKWRFRFATVRMTVGGAPEHIDRMALPVDVSSQTLLASRARGSMRADGAFRQVESKVELHSFIIHCVLCVIRVSPDRAYPPRFPNS